MKKVTIYYNSNEDCISIKDKLIKILNCSHIIFDNCSKEEEIAVSSNGKTQHFDC